MRLESHDGSITVTDVALLVALGEPRCDLGSVKYLNVVAHPLIVEPGEL
jgi:hypothetical protein